MISPRWDWGTGHAVAELQSEVERLRAAHAETRAAWLGQGTELAHWQRRAQEQDVALQQAEARLRADEVELRARLDHALRYGEGQRALVVNLDAEIQRLRTALYAEAWALDTMHRVAQACMEPTHTSLDGESRARWPQAKRELEKAREVSDPIFAALAATQPEEACTCDGFHTDELAAGDMCPTCAKRAAAHPEEKP